MGEAQGPPRVTFLSDFGADDVFVGLCHLAVLAACPQAQVVDLSHAVAPQNIMQGAARLSDAVAWVPAPAVHLAVVDPGVGTSRAGVVVRCGNSYLVGPDNGLLGWAVRQLGGVDRAWRLTEPDGASATFHGRDVFAPAAGRLAAGTDPAALGTPFDPADLVVLASPPRSVGAGFLRGQVRDIDRYGNLQLWARPQELSAAGIDEPVPVTVHAGGARSPARRVRTFGDLDEGAVGVIQDAFGWVAVVVAGGSAQQRFGVGLGESVAIASGLTSIRADA